MSLIDRAQEASRGAFGVSATASIRVVLPTIMAVVLLGGSTPAHAGLIIDPTFDPSLTGAEQGAIMAAITTIESDITSPNNITVSIYYDSTNTGLGESEVDFYHESYYNFYNALAAVATQPDQLTALASLGAAPTQFTGNPVNGTGVIITSAEGRNLGFNTPGGVTVGAGTYDGEILLNTSITSPPNGLSGYYGLEAVANHETDEVLGIGGAGSTIGGTGFFATGVGDLDLFRYTCNVTITDFTCGDASRSYSTAQTTSPYSYFSINGGTTVLSYFNQTAGADYGDWLSNPIPAGFGPQVQDAFGEPGTDPTLGVNELTAFNAIGYDLVSPEPSSLLLFGSSLALVAGVGRRRLGLTKSHQS